MTGMRVLTLACPEALRDDARALVICLGWLEGYDPGEWDGALAARLEDARGHPFRAMSMHVSDSFLARAARAGTLRRPPDDLPPYRVNLAGALRARDALVIWTPDAGEAVPLAATDAVMAVIGLPGRAALDGMGLRRVADDDDA